MLLHKGNDATQAISSLAYFARFIMALGSLGLHTDQCQLELCIKSPLEVL